ncbi:molybdenum cofactor guanylyltransferase MobA [Chitinimonas koreensis]|uniref:molybdenum cofactor guanylyltransferase MobA n=1 Tax=Chitinimonas koreensis TaxID=356302 RepID=UPI0003FC5D9C|nr:molybdenum cofactor guanylyltransferase MobA [Chitinimonas koreensis]QNM95992.1 molybdenum cofactor guanylyltransferase [Chitinimonas koreensis]
MPAYAALILAGGQGSRMDGRDKGLVEWQGRPLFRHALARLAAQTVAPAAVLLSANRNQAVYAEAGLPVLADLRAGFNGPLAGIEAGLRASPHDWLLCLPCDMPRLPATLAERLLAGAAATGGTAAHAVTADAPQPVCCLLRRELAADLAAWLDAGQGRVRGWLERVGAVPIHFDEADGFANFNTLAELAPARPAAPEPRA